MILAATPEDTAKELLKQSREGKIILCPHVTWLLHELSVSNEHEEDYLNLLDMLCGYSWIFKKEGKGYAFRMQEGKPTFIRVIC